MLYILSCVLNMENLLCVLSIPGNIYYGIVTVELNNQEVVSDGCDNEQEATESAYRKLACQFGLTPLEGGYQ